MLTFSPENLLQIPDSRKGSDHLLHAHPLRLLHLFLLVLHLLPALPLLLICECDLHKKVNGSDILVPEWQTDR